MSLICNVGLFDPRLSGEWITDELRQGAESAPLEWPVTIKLSWTYAAKRRDPGPKPGD